MQPPQKSIRRNSPNGPSGLPRPQPESTGTKPETSVDGSPGRPPSFGDVPQIPESPPGSPRDTAEENSEESFEELLLSLSNRTKRGSGPAPVLQSEEENSEESFEELLLSLSNKTKRGSGPAPVLQSETDRAVAVKVLSEVLEEFAKFPAGDVLKPLRDGMDALDSREGLSDADYLIARAKLEKEQESIAELVLSVMNALKLYPLRRRDILDKFQEAVASGDLTDRIKQTYGFTIDDVASFQDDLSAVEKIEKEGAEGLSPARMQELIVYIVANYPALTGQAAASFGRALCKLYLSLDLDPRFAQHDLEVRARILARLKSELKDECRKWSTLNSDERLAALKKARDIQCAERGIPGGKPEIVLANELNQHTPNGWAVTLAFFKRQEGTIYINKGCPAWQDFDEVIDSLVHENTHNYQYWLISQLSALPPMEKDDPRYFQATLFALNQDHGYIEGGESYLTQTLALAVYQEQPMEKHAFLAGGEAKGLFRPDALREAEALLTRLEEMLRESPGHSGLEQRIEMLSKTITNPKLPSNAIYQDVDEVLTFLSRPD